MDMQQAKMLKNDLEIAVTKLFKDFEVQTGLEITFIDLNKDCRIDGKRTIRNVAVDVLFR